MEQIINYRDIPTDQRLDILNALAQIGFFPPKNVVINHIPTNMEDKTGDSPYLNVIWKDQDGDA